MNRMDKEKYSTLIRGDYVEELDNVKRDRERDECIREAIEYYLSLPQEKRRKEAAVQRTRISHPENVEPNYYMWLEILSLPDELAERFETSDDFADSTKKLNSAIRLWLKEKAGVERLQP